MQWMLRLVGTGIDGQPGRFDVMKIDACGSEHFHKLVGYGHWLGT
jgi:hypothetical protein